MERFTHLGTPAIPHLRVIKLQRYCKILIPLFATLSPNLGLRLLYHILVFFLRMSMLSNSCSCTTHPNPPCSMKVQVTMSTGQRVHSPMLDIDGDDLWNGAIPMSESVHGAFRIISQPVKNPTKHRLDFPDLLRLLRGYQQQISSNLEYP